MKGDISTAKLIVLFVTLHLLLILSVSRVDVSRYQLLATAPSVKPIKSFLFVNPSAVKQISPDTSSSQVTVPYDKAPQVMISTKADTYNEKSSIDESADTPLIDSEEKLNSSPRPSVTTLHDGVSSYFQKQRDKALDLLSEHAAAQFRRPKSDLEKSELKTQSQKMKALSREFAAEGSGIVVISEYGAQETTILHKDNCYAIKETELNNRVWQGVAVWTRSGSCGRYDTMGEQLKQSLSKHIKR